MGTPCCPPRQELELLLEDGLSTADLRRVSAHVAVCADCQRALESLTAESAVDCPSWKGLREEGVDTPRHDFLDRIKQVPLFSPPHPKVPGSSDADGPTQHLDGGAAALREVIRVNGAPAGLDDYEILGVLGSGGEGVVYKARHRPLDRLVALKMVRDPGQAGADSLARFRREAETLARLQHPNIVQVFEVGSRGGQPFFAMEYVEGGTLAERLSGQPLPGGVSASLIEALARAVHAAHQAGVLHRDLKPANILLESDEWRAASGEQDSTLAARPAPLVPKISDFGVAKQVQGERGLTQTGAVLGTPSYMAPEQARGDGKDVGPGCDVYSLGSILYHLLTGRPPFVGSRAMDVLLQVAHLDPVAPHRLAPQTPRDLETICLKCLQKDPRRRYPSAAALADDLRRYLDGRPIQARPASALYQLGKFARRNKAAVGGAAGVVLALVVGLAFTLFYAFGEARQHRLAEQNAEAALQEAYLGRIAAATAALDGHDVAEARRQLDAAPNALHDWEWRHLESRLDESSEGIRPHDGESLGLVSSPLGIRLLAHSPDRLLLRAEDGRELHSYALSYSPEICVQEGLQGTRIGVVYDDRTVILDEAGKELVRLPPLRHLFFSPDFKYLAATTEVQRRPWDQFDLIEIATGRTVAQFHGKGEYMHALAFSPDSSLLVAGWEDGTAQVWSVRTGKETVVLRGHELKVLYVAFRPDGQRVLTASADGTVRQWDPKSGEEVEAPYERHTGEVLVAAYSPDGEWIASSGSDRTIRLWKAHGRKDSIVRLGHTGPVRQLTFSADGRRLASASEDGTIRLWETDPQSSLPVLGRHSSYVYPVAYSPDGRWIASGSWDSTVRLWDARTGEACAVLRHPSRVLDLAFTPDSSRLVSACGDDNQLRIWDLATGELVKQLEGPGTCVTALAVRTDGAQLAAVDEHGNGTIIDVATGARLAFFPPGTFGKMAYSPDGNLLAAAGKGGLVLLYDARTYRRVAELSGHEKTVVIVAFNADGRRLITAGYDRTVRIWDVEQRECLKVLSGHTDDVFAAVFHPDGTRVASAGRDGIIWLWDVATGKEVARLRGHANYVWSLDFSPDGKTLVSSSGDGTVRLWETEPLAKRYQARREARTMRGEPR